MKASPSSASIRRLPQVVVATFAVIGAPIVAVSALRATGAVTSAIPLVAAGVVLSIAASYLGAAAWATRGASGDVLFSDLMLWGWLKRWRAERQLASAVGLLGLREPAGHPRAELDSSRRVQLLKQLAAALEARYPDTHGHSRRVARHATAIAKQMGLAPGEVARIRTAAAVHDVGKFDIPKAIIEKPGGLTDAEFAVVKRHAEIGARMVAGLGDDALTRIVRHHHERLDGTGYPDGLAGTGIPLGARVVAVADTFDALTSTRSYRSARRHKEALALLGAEAGTQLDPDVVHAFRSYYSGVRPVAIWALLLNGPRQLIASLAGEVKRGGVVSAATLATVATGSVMVPALPVDSRAAAPRTSDAASQLAASPRAGGAVRSEGAGALRRPPGGAGKGAVGSGGSAAAGPGDRVGTGRNFGSPSTPSVPIGAETSVPAGSDGGTGGGSRDGGSGGASRDGGSNGGGGSGDGGNSSDGGETTQRVVSGVTDPVTSTVDAVVETVESVESDPIGVEPIVEDVRSVLPKLPDLGLGGK